MADNHWGHDGAILDNGNADKSERRVVCVVSSISLRVVGYERRIYSRFYPREDPT
jgi:hypothetical protein